MLARDVTSTNHWVQQFSDFLLISIALFHGDVDYYSNVKEVVDWFFHLWNIVEFFFS